MDIVERLRTETPSYVLIGDAAIEIERLREALENLLMYEPDYSDSVWKAARAALQSKGE